MHHSRGKYPSVELSHTGREPKAPTMKLSIPLWEDKCDCSDMGRAMTVVFPESLTWGFLVSNRGLLG